MNNSLPVDPLLSMKAAQDMELVQHKMRVDALRKQLVPEQDPKVKLREACQGFEAVFIQKMWEEMRNNVPKAGYLHSKDEQMYQSMFDHEFSKKMASAGGIGLADMLYDQLAQTLGDSSRAVRPGVNPRLPVIPASSSPSNLRFAGQDGQGSVNALPDEQAKIGIKPQYEEFNEIGPAAAEETGEANPASLPGTEVAAEAELDFEAISQALLHEEMQGRPENPDAAQKREASARGAVSWGGGRVHAPGGTVPSTALPWRRVNKKI
ncbi:MAG: rod-binding protein [Deltaproteobacteria bacterium]|jgi:Rod binding domain-containing protein|nr:rod-binding protein [Deltaproteobacteria bacterium]